MCAASIYRKKFTEKNTEDTRTVTHDHDFPHRLH